MANLNNSSNTFAYMSAATAPRWQTPASLKRSYRQTLAADKTYDALINATLRQYGNVQPLQRTAQYRNLVNLYNQAYMQNALAAANAAQRMSAGAAAGFGNSYAAAVSAGALDRHMAKRGEAMPALMAVAQKAYQNDKSGKLKAIRAMRAQRSLQTNAARDLFNAQLAGIAREVTSKQKAHATSQKALDTLLKKQLAYEKALAKKK